MDARNKPGDPTDAADALRRSVLGLARQLRRLRSDHEISAGKLGLLRRLERSDRPLTASDLASSRRLQPQSLTRLVADLAERGLIRRRRDEHDRRQLLIEITGKGRDLLANEARRQNEWLSEAISGGLTPAERALLQVAAQLLEQLIETPETPPEQV